MRELTIREIEWLNMFQYACKYYDFHGNLEVPNKFKTKDGINYSIDGKINLGSWIKTQRQSYMQSKLSRERKDMLDKIGMRFENVICRLSWEEMYDFAVVYYILNGNLEISRFYCVTTEDNKKIGLGEWIIRQRKLYKQGKLSQERKDKLEKICMRFECNFLLWEEMYGYASKYYEYHGNLEAPIRFKTNDGINYSIDGKINLGEWLKTQRQSFRRGKLSQERKARLDKIGMIWNLRRYKEVIKECERINIDYKINKDIIGHITLEELEGKIRYLESNGESVVDERGRLHKIFNMSNMDIQMEFGISLEDIIIRGKTLTI